MNWNDGIRQSHRWLSIIFTAAVMANFLARALTTGEPSPWITYAPLAPLFLMLVSGLYLFALPSMAKWRDRPSAMRRRRHNG